MTPERANDLGRPTVLPGDLRAQVREAIRQELRAWGYGPPDVPLNSLSTDLAGAVFTLDAVRDLIDGHARVTALYESTRSQPFIYVTQLDRALRGDQ